MTASPLVFAKCGKDSFIFDRSREPHLVPVHLDDAPRYLPLPVALREAVIITARVDKFVRYACDLVPVQLGCIGRTEHRLDPIAFAGDLMIGVYLADHKPDEHTS